MYASTPITPHIEPAMRIALVDLPKAYRGPVAEWMKEHRPSVYEWLCGDQCKMIRSMMDAAPILELNEIEAAELLKIIPGLSRSSV